MKRGNDDDKIMGGPMFPRLHVNDTEKGGPRAPPRNKMALYEQLTVPSQRYNIGAVPHNPNNSSSLVSSTSTNQGTGRERNACFPFYQPPLAPSSNEIQARQAEAVCLTIEPTQVLNRKKPVEEDDFMVPVLSQPQIGLIKSKDGERHTLASSHNSMSFLSNDDKLNNKSNSGDLIPREHVINRKVRKFGASDGHTRSSDILMREKDGGIQCEDTFGQQNHQEKQRLSSVGKTDVCLSGKHEENILAAGIRYGESASDMLFEGSEIDIPLRLKQASRLGCGYKDAVEVDKGVPRIEDDHSLEGETVDRGNDVSETSMVDSASGPDITPDDVVGVIGRKHFWKARTAIVNQQRVFAVQVFELHRLLKVQKLIAESPHLLLNGSAFVGKTSCKDSTAKKYSSDYGVKAQSHTTKLKDNSECPADKMEGTAENAVAKVPDPSPNASQIAGYPSFSVNPTPSPPDNTDPKMGPWGFQQPAVHQWLVPVMSPSEGLVYKPYPVAGMMGSMYGCGGPPGLTPLAGNMMNLPYGMPNPHYHQGMAMPPAFHFGAQVCFPPYAMPTMSMSVSGSAVDQMNQFSGSNPYGQMVQPAAASANRSLQHQSSCNMPSKKNGTSAPTVKSLPPKERELQGSTASSPSERSQGTERVSQPVGHDALTLFPATPVNEISEGAHAIAKPSRVIRVTPHNAKSNKESAARIFQSIQAERQQHESS